SFRVAGDQPAQNDTSVKIHALQHCLHDFTANVFKVYLDAVRRGGRELLFPVGLFVVDGGVEAQIFRKPGAFVVATGDAHDAATLNLTDLPNDAAVGAR